MPIPNPISLGPNVQGPEEMRKTSASVCLVCGPSLKPTREIVFHVADFPCFAAHPAWSARRIDTPVRHFIVPLPRLPIVVSYCRLNVIVNNRRRHYARSLDIALAIINAHTHRAICERTTPNNSSSPSTYAYCTPHPAVRPVFI